MKSTWPRGQMAQTVGTHSPVLSALLSLGCCGHTMRGLTAASNARMAPGGAALGGRRGAPVAQQHDATGSKGSGTGVEGVCPPSSGVSKSLGNAQGVARPPSRPGGRTLRENSESLHGFFLNFQACTPQPPRMGRKPILQRGAQRPLPQYRVLQCQGLVGAAPHASPPLPPCHTLCLGAWATGPCPFSALPSTLAIFFAFSEAWQCYQLPLVAPLP